MRHVILTCKNHTKLLWSTKEIAVSGGKYNGSRNIYFLGSAILKDGKPEVYSDGSGIVCAQTTVIRNEKGEAINYKVIRECDCAADCLLVAPEDSLIKREE